MLDQLADLQRREQMLIEANKSLKRRLVEGNPTEPHQAAWDPDMQGVVAYGRQASQGAQAQGFFHQLDCEPTLQIGYHQSGCPDQITIAAPGPSVNNYMPGWLA